jgi:hypothetical protein
MDPFPHSVCRSYGSGTPFHFVERLLYVVGLPLYALFWIALLALLVAAFRRSPWATRWWFVAAPALLYIAAHNFFWYAGLFHSMGLKRVLVGIAPLLALLALLGFDTAASAAARLSRLPARVWHSALGALVLAFPFLPNPASLQADRDLRLRADQHLAQELADRIARRHPGPHRYLFAHPYLAMALVIDPFDPAQHAALDAAPRPGDLLIWDDWFAVVEGGVSASGMAADGRWREVERLNANDHGRAVELRLYEPRP